MRVPAVSGLKVAALYAASFIAALGQQLQDVPLRAPDSGLELEGRAARQALPSQAMKSLQRQAPVMEPRYALNANGAVRLLSGFVSRPYSGSSEQAAFDFLSEHRDLLGTKERPEFRTNRIFALEGKSFVRLQQAIDGLPVVGAEVVLAVNRENTVGEIGSTYIPGLKLSGEWRISNQEAIEAVLASKPLIASGEIQTEKWFLPIAGSAIPVWRVRIPSDRPLGDWDFLVSADSGEVVDGSNLIRGQGRGFAFPTNPIRGPLEQVRLDNLTTARTLTGSFAKVYSYLPNLLGLLPPGLVAEQLALATGDGTFPYRPFDPRFSEVQLYYAIDRVHARFRALGFSGLDRPLEGVVYYEKYSDVNGFFGANNAFFSPDRFSGRGGLFFFLTARGDDTSWDSDVIFHEYTHAVVNQIVGPAQGKVFGALNEGFADYFSASFLGDPNVGEWDALIWGKRLPFIRTVQNSNTFPKNVVGEIHADGTIWSGALWDVRTTLGPDRADRIALRALAILTGQAEFFDAALAAAIAADGLYGRSVGDQVPTL